MKPEVRNRTITSEEVKSWFGNTVKGRLPEDQYAKIATSLNKCRWPSDPPLPEEVGMAARDDEPGLLWDALSLEFAVDVRHTRFNPIDEVAANDR